jgi:hypothetical protein
MPDTKLKRDHPGEVMRLRTLSFSTLLLLACLASVLAAAKAQPRPNDKKDDQPTVKLRIELTGGDDSRPLPDASVYLRFQLDPKAKKSKQSELNLKTNQEGVAISPPVPQGMILIQVIAPGWKTYGQWHDIEQPEETVSIHLSRPTTNYY